jgi:hypothetical protein
MLNQSGPLSVSPFNFSSNFLGVPAPVRSAKAGKMRTTAYPDCSHSRQGILARVRDRALSRREQRDVGLRILAAALG